MFNNELENTFQIFSIQHTMALLLIAIVIALLLYFKDYFKDPLRDRMMRKILITVILVQEIILNVYRFYNAQLTLEIALPLHLCSIAIILSSYILYSKNIKVFKSTYLIMMIGAAMAIFTPSIEQGFGFPHFRYYQFFLSHGLIVLNLVYILFVMGFNQYIDYKDVWRNYITLLVLFFIALVTNVIIGNDANYMYAMGVPSKGTAFDLFGPHPWYLVNIALFVGPILLHLFYLIVIGVNVRKGYSKHITCATQ